MADTLTPEVLAGLEQIRRDIRSATSREATDHFQKLHDDLMWCHGDSLFDAAKERDRLADSYANLVEASADHIRRAASERDRERQRADAAEAKLAFLEEKGVRVGAIKSSDRHGEYLAYVIRSGSELDDSVAVMKQIEAEQRADDLAKQQVEMLRKAATSYLEFPSMTTIGMLRAALAATAPTEPKS